MKYILVTGGSLSGIGKGILSSSIGALLKSCRLNVTAIKIDPYINIDAGTLSPFEHGEVYVLNDGCEVDLDLGNYERFLDIELSSKNNITTGRIFQKVIDREQRGDYDGQTARIIPHITNAIREWIEDAASGCDICIIEQGGTVGDIEAMPFIEALRQLRRSKKPSDFCCVHMNLVPFFEASRELKSKLVQESVRVLRAHGILPDIIVCRSKVGITDAIKEKISDFCDVIPERVVSLPDVRSTYSVPLSLYHQDMIRILSECLKLDSGIIEARTKPQVNGSQKYALQTNGLLSEWDYISMLAIQSEKKVAIAFVGKYTSLGDTYFSVMKALEHACFHYKARPDIRLIESTDLEANRPEAWEQLKSSSCLLVPGGFGYRGAEGKMLAINWARENKVPFLGICLGFQLAVVEYARNVVGITDANSDEFADEINSHSSLIIQMLEYKDAENKLGGTMRLGSRPTHFVKAKSIVKEYYNNEDIILERHRHRYEVNPDYVTKLEAGGLKFVGKNDDGTRMEILELDEEVHPFFVGVQYHPEYKTRPFRPSPPYVGLVHHAIHYEARNTCTAKYVL